jgi:hypothetical protein
MNERLTDTPFEFSVRLTGKEVAFVRAAITKAASAEESKAAAQLFFKNLRARAAKYTIRELYGMTK